MNWVTRFRLQNFEARFVWKKMGFRGARILNSVSEADDPLYGDCKSYSLTVMWIIAHCSIFLMILRVLFFQSVPWFVLVNGSWKRPHISTWVRKEGWICNAYPSFRPRTPATRIFPLPLIVYGVVIAAVMV